MVNVDEDLRSLLDRFNESREKFKNEKENKEKRVSEFKNEFELFATNKIKPIMIEYKKLLENKNIGCDVEEKSASEYRDSYSSVTLRRDSDSSIALIVDYNTETSSRAAHKPQIRFYPKDESIIVYEQKFEPSGGGSAGVEGSYEKERVTDDFIRSKIGDFLKEIFSKSWTEFDFY
ncbi:MAG TPA: hypothetical protein VD710_06445 [Nitrososphaeraceae archaeon]|nr:hypothetical protein [Nitrososphaeraceae archaeon]